MRVTLDIDQGSHLNWGASERYGNDTVELTVQVAASVCESLHRQHCRIELVLNDQLLVAGESASSFHRVMDALAQASPVETTKGLIRRRTLA